ncbi:Protein of unknown function [Lactobacillus delbrueckii subsp. lactis]|nr:Protein of unknown function [Lactobacillus delbrueckii subsp. lactis]
MGQDQAGHRHG